MLEKEKELVLKTAKKAYSDGLFAGTSGNLSVFDRKSRRIVITPTNLSYEIMTLEDIVVTDENGKVTEGIHEPSSEWRLHAAVYLDREDMDAVVHTHSPYATSFAAAGEEIPLALIEMVPFLGGSVKVADFAINGTPEVGEYTVKALKNRFAALLKNHGAIAIGKNLDAALLSAVYLEDAAKIITLAKLHGKVETLSAEDEQKMLDKYGIVRV